MESPPTQLAYEDVQSAAEQLLSQGRIPGPTTVRQITGRGSFSTIAKHLKTFEARRIEEASREAEEKRHGPPEELLGELERLVAMLWPAAIARAHEELQPEMEAFQAQVENFKVREAEALHEITELENKLSLAESEAAKVADLTHQLKESQRQVIGLKDEVNAAQRDVNEAQKRELDMQSGQGKLTGELKLAQNRIAELESDLGRSQAEAQKVESLQSEIKTLSGDLSKIRLAEQNVRSELTATQIALKSAEKDNEQLTRAHDLDVGKLAELQERVTELIQYRARFEEQSSHLADLRGLLEGKAEQTKTSTGKTRK